MKRIKNKTLIKHIENCLFTFRGVSCSIQFFDNLIPSVQPSSIYKNSVTLQILVD